MSGKHDGTRTQPPTKLGTTVPRSEETETERAADHVAGPPAETSTAAEAADATGVSLYRRARQAAKDHPAAVLVAGAVAGTLAGVEWAAGALLGIGAAMLFSRKSGPEIRRNLVRRGRELMDRLRAGEPGAPAASQP
jgi:hypothetical protein